jgi:hypothetical protein
LSPGQVIGETAEAQGELQILGKALLPALRACVGTARSDFVDALDVAGARL